MRENRYLFNSVGHIIYDYTIYVFTRIRYNAVNDIMKLDHFFTGISFRYAEPVDVE